MQFSIEGLFEMIEKRLGKFPAFVFLLLVVVAIATFCLRVVWDSALAPLSSYLKGDNTAAAKVFLQFLATLFVGILAITGGISMLLSTSRLIWFRVIKNSVLRNRANTFRRAIIRKLRHY